MFKRENYIPPITYYLNIASEADVNNHAIPFIKDLSDLEFFNNNLNVIVYNEVKEKPHGPLSVRNSKKIVKTFAKIHLYNGTDNIDELDIINFDTTKYINKIEKENKKLKNQNKKLINSRSWKITKPLRKVRNLRK